MCGMGPAAGSTCIRVSGLAGATAGVAGAPDAGKQRIARWVAGLACA